MKILIIEDEESAAIQLKDMLSTLLDSPEFAEVIDSVEDAVDFLSTDPPVDLIFLDIYLSDGISFEIFDQVTIDLPIIFTTAFDQYAVRAFEVNSVDYLLKPIRKEKLQKALQKYDRLESRPQPILDNHMLQALSQLMKGEKNYKRTFLIPYQDRLIPVPTDSIAWFELTHSVVRGVTFEQKQLIMEEKSLDELAENLNPTQFYRANRQFLINRKAIREIEYFFNGRLCLKLLPAPNEKVIISKAKARSFKEWIKA